MTEDTPPAPLINTRNGYTRPLHYEQILSWVGYFIMIAAYFLIIYPSLLELERIICTIIFCLSWVIFNGLFIRASLEKHRSAILPDESKERYMHCKWCKRNVDLKAKHCRSCNLCRLNFDHHCFFLNNCVTNDNYNYFFSGIIFLYIAALVESFLSLYIIMGITLDHGSMITLASKFYGGLKVPKPLWYVLHGLLLFMNLGIEYFITFLLGLHFCLIKKNITTFDVIMYRRNKAQNDKAKQNTIKMLEQHQPAPVPQTAPPPAKPLVAPAKIGPAPDQPKKEEQPKSMPIKDEEKSYSTSSSAIVINEPPNEEPKPEPKKEEPKPEAKKEEPKPEPVPEPKKEEEPKHKEHKDHKKHKKDKPKEESVKEEPKKEEEPKADDKKQDYSYSYYSDSYSYYYTYSD